MHAFDRFRLRSEMRVLEFPSVCPESRQSPYSMFVANTQEPVETLDESFGVVIIDKDGQEYAYGIEAKVFRQGQFPVGSAQREAQPHGSARDPF